MKLWSKLLLLSLVSVVCLYGIQASCQEIAVGDYWTWGESDRPPNEWVLMLGGPCMLVLLWSVGWAGELMLKFFVARHYGLEK